jgi:hypothetical protein
MPNEITVTFDEQISEVEREIAQRERFYHRWIATRGMDPVQADRQIARLRAVLETLQVIKIYALIDTLPTQRLTCNRMPEGMPELKGSNDDA